MKDKHKEPPIPEERSETVRQQIIHLLEHEELSAGELSQLVRKSEKEIYEELTHIQKAAHLVIEPAKCLDCGFVFQKRERPKKPGRCPKCKSTHIGEPIFFIKP